MDFTDAVRPVVVVDPDVGAEPPATAATSSGLRVTGLRAGSAVGVWSAVGAAEDARAESDLAMTQASFKWMVCTRTVLGANMRTIGFN
ncbi:hypothetical protein [Methylobacterium sp. JK268]